MAGSLNSTRTRNTFVPSWLDGTSCHVAVNSTGTGAAVDALVSRSSVPRSSVNVTRTRKCLPWSASTGVYVLDVAPAISVPAAPAPSPRSHW